MSESEGADIERFLASHGPFEKAPLLRSGEMVGDWRVTAYLGRGATSEVYRAENAVTHQVGAVKLFMRGDDRALARFRREVSLLAEADSVALPRFYGAGEHAGRAFLAMELLEPAELPSADSAVARFVLGVCAGVEALHSRGYVHRDIKPRNVMLRPTTHEPVLIDLGLAKESEESPHSVSDTVSVVDGHAVGVGTVGYSAPEQFSGGKIGAAADVHALGMLANACFKGRPPKAWAEIIRRSTSSAPEQRYATVTAFVRAVRRRHLFRQVLVSVGLFAVTVAVALVAVFRSTHETKSSPSGEEDAPVQPESGLEVVSDLLSLGTTKRGENAEVTTVMLDGRDIKVSGEVVLQKGQQVVVFGPGRLTAAVSGDQGASMELRRHATLVNLTARPYPESAMKYVVSGTSYLNFKNLRRPESGDIKNVWVDDLSGDGREPIVLFGGPDTYDAARKTIGFFL